MSLNGALSIGKSALAVSQAQLQVTGNNIANAGNAGYTRQTAQVSTAKDRELRPGVFMGTGVDLNSIRRQIDEALEGRLRASVSDSASADTAQLWMGRVESVFNELGDKDLSTAMSTFFKSWSNLANKPQDVGLRQVVLQNGATLASRFKDVRSKFEGLRADTAGKLAALTTDANQLAAQVADLNKQVVVAEGGGRGQANGLRDQRDGALKQLSELVDVRTIAQENGSVNAYLGSEPLVTGSTSRGLALKEEMVGGRMDATVVFADNKGEATVGSGQIGGIIGVRGTIDATVDQLDALAKGMIFEVNKLHAGGQGLKGLAVAQGTNAVDDATLALNDPAANLPFAATTGSFVLHVKEKATGLTTSTLVQVDLDGLNADDTSLDDLVAAVTGVAGVTATSLGGKLRVAADSDAVEFSFSQDTSGALAALGVNTFFTGTGSFDVAVDDALRADPSLLAAAKNGQPADNQTARAIADVELATLKGLNGGTLKDAYQSMVNSVSVATASSKTNAEAARVVQETLFNQREALSGVSMDEEAVNLMRQQRAFQGASRLISVVNDLMDQLLSLVR